MKPRLRGEIAGGMTLAGGGWIDGAGSLGVGGSWLGACRMLDGEEQRWWWWQMATIVIIATPRAQSPELNLWKPAIWKHGVPPPATPDSPASRRSFAGLAFGPLS
ncbi:hypothetical protein FDECE_2486 [Fusarium decemcellulare]|nr:hypothetical protein FDECE_2486 [Fusarium decemcellulare]